MTSWMITGVTGLLGSNAALELTRSHTVIGVTRSELPTAPNPMLIADISSARGRSGIVEHSGVDVVLHAAAITSIEECEKNPELAWEMNVAASADLAGQAAARDVPFIYISTDAVFDGKRGGYDEDDAPSPTTVYGRTKLAGELAVLTAYPQALVARVNFYGWSPTGRRSLAEFFHSRLARGEQVRGFTDTVVSTLYVGQLAQTLGRLVAIGASGVLHVVSSEATSKFDFARRIADTFEFDRDLVLPAVSTDHLAVNRGSRLDLNTARLGALLGEPPIAQQYGIDDLASDYAAGRHIAVRAFSA